MPEVGKHENVISASDRLGSLLVSIEVDLEEFARIERIDVAYLANAADGMDIDERTETPRVLCGSHHTTIENFLAIETHRDQMLLRTFSERFDIMILVDDRVP